MKKPLILAGVLLLLISVTLFNTAGMKPLSTTDIAEEHIVYPFTGEDYATKAAGYTYNASDTVPAKKKSKKLKNPTTPYDSFGKPKKMDSSRINK